MEDFFVGAGTFVIFLELLLGSFGVVGVSVGVGVGVGVGVDVGVGVGVGVGVSVGVVLSSSVLVSFLT